MNWWAKLSATISMIIFLTAITTPSRLLNNQNLSSAAPAVSKSFTLFYNGVEITTQSTILIDGYTYIPLQILIDQITNFNIKLDRGNNHCTITSDKYVIDITFDSPRVLVDGVELMLKSSVRLIDQKAYVSLEFIRDVLGCSVIEFQPSDAILIFSKPLINGDAGENKLLNCKLQEYLTTNLYSLPENYSALHKKFAQIIHPGDIEIFCQNLLDAISTPTSWGAVEFVESGIVARTTDAAVVYYKVKYNDGFSEDTIEGLWGLQKYNSNWYLRWSQ